MQEGQGPAFRPERVKPGEKPTARKYNQLVDGVARWMPCASPARQPDVAPKGSTVMQFEVGTVFDDYLLCYAHNGADSEPTDYKGGYRIAKPAQLRGSLASHDGVAFTDYPDGAQERTAGGDEDQRLIPQYVEGDVIYAIGPIVNGIRVQDRKFDPEDENEEPTYRWLEWLDLNVDARFWAKVHGDPEACS